MIKFWSCRLRIISGRTGRWHLTWISPGRVTATSAFWKFDRKGQGAWFWPWGSGYVISTVRVNVRMHDYFWPWGSVSIISMKFENVSQFVYISRFKYRHISQIWQCIAASCITNMDGQFAINSYIMVTTSIRTRHSQSVTDESSNC